MTRLGWATQPGPSGPRGRRAAALTVALASFLTPGLLTAGAARGAPGVADSRAAAVARSLADAMGGQATWDSLPYVRFDFVVARDGKEIARFSHWWDKSRGRCRVEGPDEKGRTVCAIVNLSDRKGKTFTDGLADTDSSNIANILQMGYERWVNDTYWLMMPFKLRDPGTHLKYASAKRGEADAEHDVLELTFDPGVGLTPKDHYWLFVNRKSHLLDRWEYVLQDMKSPAQEATWEEWVRVGPVRLSTLHRFQGKNTILRFEKLATPATMDESVFTDARPKG